MDYTFPTPSHHSLTNPPSGRTIGATSDLQSVWGELELIRYDDQIDALGDLKARDATDLLLKIFRHQYSWEGSSWRTKMKVLIALGKIGNEQALPDASRNITSRSDWYVRQGALNYLIHISCVRHRGCAGEQSVTVYAEEPVSKGTSYAVSAVGWPERFVQVEGRPRLRRALLVTF
jgi:hypothetical protein